MNVWIIAGLSWFVAAFVTAEIVGHIFRKIDEAEPKYDPATDSIGSTQDAWEALRQRRVGNG